MDSPIYEGEHRDLFDAFLKLVDDYDAQLTAILKSSPWQDVRSILTIGGGQGVIEASLLRSAPHSRLWYLDPSEEQCEAFRQYMQSADLLGRVHDIAQTSFQDFMAEQKFDRIVSVFSWFYIGIDDRCLSKLLDLLAQQGTALLIMPNSESIETVLYKAFSPDKRMTLVGEEIAGALSQQKCNVKLDTYTKWLSHDALFDGEQLSNGSLAFAAFAAERPFTTFSADEKMQVASLIRAGEKAQGVPLSWDLIQVNPV